MQIVPVQIPVVEKLRSVPLAPVIRSDRDLREFLVVIAGKQEQRDLFVTQLRDSLLLLGPSSDLLDFLPGESSRVDDGLDGEVELRLHFLAATALRKRDGENFVARIRKLKSERIVRLDGSVLSAVHFRADDRV